jgi:hypothetical protein
MKGEEAFRLGYKAALDLMMAFDGPATVTDELVDYIVENEDHQAELYVAKRGHPL